MHNMMFLYWFSGVITAPVEVVALLYTFQWKVVTHLESCDCGTSHLNHRNSL